MNALEGKVVFITGCAKGIGEAITRKLAAEGAILAMTDFDTDALHKLHHEIINVSPQSIALSLDVTKEEEIKTCVAKAKETFGRIDVLANNAGVSSMNKFTDLTEEEWDWNMDVNLKSVWRVTKHIAPLMMAQKSGSIVITASMASKLGAPFLAHYSASKFGVLGYAQSIAKELADFNIRVNSVCPGLVKTAMQDREIVWEAQLRGIDDPEKVRSEYIEMTPLNRLCLPTDVANVVAFLASDQSSFMTGQALNVTGGICVH
jgi:NAD(P)-dependent dehydrogenase (short-subunit alcohol dehydrogenase family)